VASAWRVHAPLAEQTGVPQPNLEAAGPGAEVSVDRWLIPLRSSAARPFHLYDWTRSSGQRVELNPAEPGNAVEPVVVSSRVPPRDFPSARVPTRTTGNLLCLNAHESKTPIAGDIATVRVFTQDAAGSALLLGQTVVESDGSFYVQVPADRPLRMELWAAPRGDAGGKELVLDAPQRTTHLCGLPRRPGTVA